MLNRTERDLIGNEIFKNLQEEKPERFGNFLDTAFYNKNLSSSDFVYLLTVYNKQRTTIIEFAIKKSSKYLKILLNPLKY